MLSSLASGTLGKDGGDGPETPLGIPAGGDSQPFAHPKILGKTEITARRGAKSPHPDPRGLARPRSPARGGCPAPGRGGYDPQPHVSAGFCPQMKTLVTLTAGPGGPAAPVSPSLPGRPCGGEPPQLSSILCLSFPPPQGQKMFQMKKPPGEVLGGGAAQQNQLTRSPGAPGSPFSPAFPGSP